MSIRSWCVEGALLQALYWQYRACARATGAAGDGGNWCASCAASVPMVFLSSCMGSSPTAASSASPNDFQIAYLRNMFSRHTLLLVSEMSSSLMQMRMGSGVVAL